MNLRNLFKTVERKGKEKGKKEENIKEKFDKLFTEYQKSEEYRINKFLIENMGYKVEVEVDNGEEASITITHEPEAHYLRDSGYYSKDGVYVKSFHSAQDALDSFRERLNNHLRVSALRKMGYLF